MLTRYGTPAFSPFRLKKLTQQLAQSLKTEIQLDSQYIHFIQLNDSNEQLSESDKDILSQVLHYGSDRNASELLSDLAENIIVTPRVGTISPWSTQATSIAKNCGLEQIFRIERGIIWRYQATTPLNESQKLALKRALHDRMTEMVLEQADDAAILFAQSAHKPLIEVNILEQGKAAIAQANQDFGLALSTDEIDYLFDSFSRLKRNPTDVELMMFAQANSEHCRHKIFNSDWIIDNQKQPHSLFKMIRNTTENAPDGVLSAYSDNAAVMQGWRGKRFFAQGEKHQYQASSEDIHILMKVETHNHPTAISPTAGAATGSGGEIRDEGATGKGSKPKAGLTGFSVSHLKIPALNYAWEVENGKPERIVSALDIMLEAPIGAAAFNNEFGRPNIAGYFRTFEQAVFLDEKTSELRGYHKPIMLAGGLGNIRDIHIQKDTFPVGSPLVVLGGPAMLIGLGGGAASSMDSGTSDEDLDFASVQRANPEMERRCQEVIDRCWGKGESNPILFIHDVGAGGLSNALPELVHDAGKGGQFELRDVANDDPSMSPMEIWSNEAQERYVMAVNADQLDEFKAICQRERCPYRVVGETLANEELKLSDRHFKNNPIDLPMSLLFGKAPKMCRDVQSIPYPDLPLKLNQADDLTKIALDVLRHPSVANKNFLITIGDRSVTGQVVRDQMVGRWQVPVADVAVTSSDYTGFKGEAMAMGERTPLALLNAGASARMAVAEAITNIAASRINKISDIRLSANWMAAAGYQGEDARLYEAVKAVGMELCPALGIAIPVGKDSMSMKTVWQQGVEDRQMAAPLSLIITAFAAVEDTRKTLTPAADVAADQCFILIDLGGGKNRLGGSILAQIHQQMGAKPADLDQPALLINFFNAIQALNQNNQLIAYHDRSDGGLWACLCEMAFASRCGLTIDLPAGDINAILFNEELGAVIQIDKNQQAAVFELLASHQLGDCSHLIATPDLNQQIKIRQDQQLILETDRITCQKAWSETSYQMQKLRDNPSCADEEFARIDDSSDGGLFSDLTFNPAQQAPLIGGAKPKIAILREQGVNGQVEMAAAFSKAGFDCIDVHMSDLIEQRQHLSDFNGLVACGGFSYGDVLGAGEGWAKTILFHHQLRDQFSAFFEDQRRFALGVCNGCQMLSNLHELIPDSAHWPHFVRNRSEQFEARFGMVEITPSPSILLRDMVGSKMPIAIAHGEGRTEFKTPQMIEQAEAYTAMKFIENNGATASKYPANPNGSNQGITGLCNKDGRITIMMPHPERVIRTVNNSWHPQDWEENSPWMRLFENARQWLA